MIFPSCNALKCRILRHFAIHALKSVMYRILPKSGLEGKMRQISASKRSRNCENRLLRFWAGILFHSITSVNISLQKNPADYHDQQGARSFSPILNCSEASLRQRLLLAGGFRYFFLGPIQFFQANHLVLGILQAKMGICVHGDTNIRIQRNPTKLAIEKDPSNTEDLLCITPPATFQWMLYRCGNSEVFLPATP